MTGSPAPDQFWAKLRYRDDDPSTGEVVEWRPLIAHSAEVSGVRMMALFDTNVLIDAAVASRSHHRAAVRLIAAAKYNVIGGLVTPTSIATCWYVAHEGEQTGPRPLFELLADVMRMAPTAARPCERPCRIRGRRTLKMHILQLPGRRQALLRS